MVLSGKEAGHMLLAVISGQASTNYIFLHPFATDVRINRREGTL
jgi:hypothetical protein